MKRFHIIALTVLVSVFVSVLGVSVASAQSWTSVTNPAPNTVGTLLQLRDGRVLAHSENINTGGTSDWYILTPSNTGSYASGTWSGPYSLQNGYGPLYFSTAVFQDGKTVIAEGGEYNFLNAVWTTLGALGTYTPWTGGITWVANAPPTGWARIGDAENSVLADGTYLQSSCCSAQTATFVSPNVWAASGSVHQGDNDESGYTALRSGKVLTVDTKSSSCGTSHGYELYSGGAWACGGFGNLPTQLFSSDEELGAAVLMYNNKVIQFGGNVVATNIYDPVADTWTVGPTPPQGLNQADGPAALEPNGKVLAMLSPGLFQSGCHFVEYDPSTNLINLAAGGDLAQCPGDSSFFGRLMILPTGQIASADLNIPTVFLYNPGGSVVSSAVPTIIPATNAYLGGSKNNILYGIQLNGLTENNAYGDDYQAATNYPLIRFTDSNNKVWYGLTHDDSSHSIAPGKVSFTKFDLNPAMPPGTYTMQVVTNGIGSNKVTVKIH